MRVSYGIEVSEKNDPYVTAVEEGVATFNEAFVPGAFLVETFPSLRHIPSWFPGGGFKRIAAEWKKIAHNMRDAPFEKTLEAMASTALPPASVSPISTACSLWFFYSPCSERARRSPRLL